MKEEWLSRKKHLEKKIIKSNKSYEVVNKIVKLIDDRDSPSPRSRAKEIMKRYNDIKLEEEMRNSSMNRKSKY